MFFVFRIFFFFFAKEDMFSAFGKVVNSIISNSQLQTTDKCIHTVCGRPTTKKKESFSFCRICAAVWLELNTKIRYQAG